MLETLAVFVLVASGSTLLGVQIWARRSRALERLTAGPALVPNVLPSPALIWRELVARLGSAVPASPKDLPRLKRRLIQAGFRHPGAVSSFYGIRAVATLVLGGLAMAISVRFYAGFDHILLNTGAAAMFGWVAPGQYLSLLIARRRHAIERGLANTLDLMVICVESGLGIDQTTLQVANELQAAHPEICDEFTVMNLELRAGKRRDEALRNLAERTGVEDVKKLVAVLIQTDRFGTGVARSLRGHAEYLRTMARQRAEERASKLAVKLVFPIFFCIMPSLFVVTVGPVMIRLVRDLLPMIENM
jgi:tight adherence protein C